ncbi:MAG TPA: RidA family protein [Gemmatimonadaceae bacterium]|nr:RidA family protein [Gemmatimonadaceae bacterium]
MRASAASLLLATTACVASVRTTTTAHEPMGIEHINLTENWPYPFSSAVRVGNMLYLAGQMGTKIVDGAPKLVTGGIDAETKQTFENIKAILAKAGSSLDNVIECKVMMADMAEWPAMNVVYASYFPGKKPARSAWGANGLALGGRVEITCMAFVPHE